MNTANHRTRYSSSVLLTYAGSALRRATILPLAVLVPATGLRAFTEGEGTQDDPFVVTSADTSLDLSSFYIVKSSLDFGSAIVSVGYYTTNNSLTITGDETVFSADTIYIGNKSKSSGSVTVTDNASAELDSDLYIGYNGLGSLSIINGGMVACSTCCVGKTTSSGNSLIIDGTDSTMECISLEIGNIYGGDGAVTVKNGGKLTSYVGKIGGFYSTNTSIITIHGVKTSWTIAYSSGEPGNLYVGNNYSADATVEIQDGATVTCGDCYIGSNYTDGETLVSLTGGSFLYASGSLYLGTKEEAVLKLCDNSLFITGGNESSVGSHGSIYLSAGNFAMKGKLTAQAVAASYGINIYNGSTWVVATAADLTATYYDGTTNVWSASDLYKVYGDRIDLTGYTVITGGKSTLLDWADVGTSEQNWHDSSWYDWFYANSITFGNWIWHSSHGWQYIYPGSTKDGTYLWDTATASWWYTNSDWYPCLYDFSTGGWYYFESGATPSRKFWDYTTGAEVGEASL